MIGLTVITKATGVTKRTHARLVRQLNRDVIGMQAENLERHFELNEDTKPGGAYGYRKRGIEYTRDKKKRFGHKHPNVRSGKLMRAVLSKVRLTATQHKATLRTSGTQQHQLATYQKRELEAVSMSERRRYAKWQAARYKRLASSPSNQSKRRVKS